jgi:hypothetical protein
VRVFGAELPSGGDRDEKCLADPDGRGAPSTGTPPAWLPGPEPRPRYSAPVVGVQV